MNYPGQGPGPHTQPYAPAGGASFQLDPQTHGAIDVQLGFTGLQWVLYLVTPKLAINGYPARKPWGTHRVPMPAGQHHVAVSFPYMFSSDCGAAQLAVPVYAGHATRVIYQAPFMMWSAGSLRVLGYVPMGTPQLLTR